jgi:hypothetical protein
MIMRPRAISQQKSQMILIDLGDVVITHQANRTFACFFVRIQLDWVVLGVDSVWLSVFGFGSYHGIIWYGISVGATLQCILKVRMQPEGHDRVHPGALSRRLTCLHGAQYHGRVRLGAACDHCFGVLASALGLCHVLGIISLHCVRPPYTSQKFRRFQDLLVVPPRAGTFFSKVRT